MLVLVGRGELEGKVRDYSGPNKIEARGSRKWLKPHKEAHCQSSSTTPLAMPKIQSSNQSWSGRSIRRSVLKPINRSGHKGKKDMTAALTLTPGDTQALRFRASSNVISYIRSRHLRRVFDLSHICCSIRASRSLHVGSRLCRQFLCALRAS